VSRRVLEYAGDAGLLLGVVFALPVAIILIGAPVVVLIRLAMYLLQRP
jgi:hypothetical protein